MDNQEFDHLLDKVNNICLFSEIKTDGFCIFKRESPDHRI